MRSFIPQDQQLKDVQGRSELEKKEKLENRQKHFTWRVYYGLLALNANLQRRHIIDDGTCKVCQQEAKTICHVIFISVNINQLRITVIMQRS